MDKITVITVCYNAAATIRNTIESVLIQDYKNYEYIVVDGASEDETLSIAETYRKDFDSKNVPLSVVSEKDNGIYDAMNKAIDMASGDWIVFMNADDSFYNADSIRLVFERDLNGCSVVYGDCVRIDGNGAYPMKANPPETLPKQMPFMHQAVFTKADLCKKYKFDLSYKLCADYDMFFKLYSLGYKFKQADVTVCNYSIRGISGCALLDAQKEVIQIKKKHSSKYPITVSDRLHWRLDAVKMRIKMIMPEQLLSELRQIKHRGENNAL